MCFSVFSLISMLQYQKALFLSSCLHNCNKTNCAELSVLLKHFHPRRSCICSGQVKRYWEAGIIRKCRWLHDIRRCHSHTLFFYWHCREWLTLKAYCALLICLLYQHLLIWNDLKLTLLCLVTLETQVFCPLDLYYTTEIFSSNNLSFYNS